MVPDVESSLVAMSDDRLSIWTEDAAKKTEIPSTDLTDTNLHKKMCISSSVPTINIASFADFR